MLSALAVECRSDLTGASVGNRLAACPPMGCPYGRAKRDVPVAANDTAPAWYAMVDGAVSLFDSRPGEQNLTVLAVPGCVKRAEVSEPAMTARIVQSLSRAIFLLRLRKQFGVWFR
jgi:hypothetical protein